MGRAPWIRYPRKIYFSLGYCLKYNEPVEDSTGFSSLPSLRVATEIGTMIILEPRLR